MQLKGKIKAIPVKEVIEGMQVCVHKMGMPGYLICKVLGPAYKSLTSSWIISIIGTQTEHQISTTDLKTLVVEYEVVCGSCRGDEYKKQYTCLCYGKPQYKQLPLKYSQWQAAIDNGLVDSDKIVEFEIGIATCKQCMLVQGMHLSPDCCGNYTQYAKIIPPKKRTYTEDEVKDIIRKVYTDGYERATAGLHWSGEIDKAVKTYLNKI
jgi:hypothetical protein